MAGFRSPYVAKFSENLFKGLRASMLILLVLILSFFLAACVKEPTTPSVEPMPPLQHASGPGGADYKHAAVSVSGYGRGEDKYWIFEPASPTPKSAPLIVFNHGWGAMNPQSYGAWIDHLVRRGNIVIYPRYQASMRAPLDQVTQNAIIAVKDAIQRLQSGEHVIPQLDKFAIVGHSLGGGITANMAALAPSVGLPEPKAIMVAEPGEGRNRNIGADILAAHLSAISAAVLMLVVVGSEDTVVGADVGRRIFNQTPQIPLQNKDFVTMFSDYHGEPPLVADHFAAVAPDDRYDVESTGFQSLIRRRIQQSLGADINALDYYGFWKLFDGLTDAAFYGKNREYALGNTAEQRFMGKWSVGRPIVELKITKSP